MPQYDVRELQLHILDILTAIDRVCREHDICYYLCDGTMLGAVRHGGFIPWDDDVDICMPRPDYTRFMEHQAEWLPKPLEAVCAENDANYPGAFGKVIDSSTTLVEREHYAYVGGIYVDVFPLDGIPSCRLLQRWQLFRFRMLSRIIYLIHRNPYKHGRGLSSWFPLLLQAAFSHQWAQQAIRRVMLNYGYEENDTCVNYDDGARGVIPKKLYGKPTPIAFEGIDLMGVEHPHEYLTHTYGDYMVIPSHNQQHQHNFFFLDYHKPYKAYNDERAFVKPQQKL